MRRFFITFITLALVVCALAVPAFATSDDSGFQVIDFLDYVDRDHLVVNGDEKHVVIDIPAEYAVSYFKHASGGIDFTLGENDVMALPPNSNPSDYYCYPTMNVMIDSKGSVSRFREGYVFDVSLLPDDAIVYFDWEISAIGYSGHIGSLNDYPEFSYTCYFWGKPDSAGWSYKYGRSHLGSIVGTSSDWNNGVLDCYAIYQHGYGTVGTASNYIAPFVHFADVGFTYTGTQFTLKTSSIRVKFPITDALISMAQNEKSQKLLDEVNRQLVEQGKTMQDVLKEQELTNDKLDGVHGAIDDTNEKLDDITDYKPEVETPEGGEVVGDLEEVEDNLMDDVNDGFDKAEDLQLSVLETLLQYVTAFGAVSYIIDLFAWIPFIKVLLSVSLALGIVSTLLNIGLSVSSGASKSKSDGKHGAKDKHSAGH